MMKKMMGFTLAEVLTTLMVIGVVAAMTIPTLMNSTNDQQLKVAYKKAMSVLGQGIQLMVAKEEECKVTNDAELASCFTKVLSGTPRKNSDGNGGTTGEANVIATSDGMAYAFYYFGENNAAERSLEQICGTTMGSSAESYKGAGANCIVIVDVNGLSKGAKKFVKDGSTSNTSTVPSAIGTDYASATDQQAILIKGTGVRPIYNTAGGSTALNGYNWMFGTTAHPYTD